MQIGYLKGGLQSGLMFYSTSLLLHLCLLLYFYSTRERLKEVKAHVASPSPPFINIILKFMGTDRNTIVPTSVVEKRCFTVLQTCHFANPSLF